MRIHAALVVATVLCSPIAAQSPLTTIYAGNNQHAAGGGVYFDLVVNVPLLIHQLDLNLASTAGTAGSVDVFLGPPTHAGNETNPGAWTLQTSGPVVAAGVNLPSTAVLAQPFLLAPGNHGVALCYRSVAARYTNGTGGNQTYSVGELTINCGTSSNVCLSSSIFTPRVWNGAIHFTVGANAATTTPYGRACNDQAISYYEMFAPGSFDLAGTPGTEFVITMLPTPSGYVVVQGTPAWHPPTSPNLGLSNASVVQRPLPFPFAFAGGTTNSIGIAADGYLWLSTIVTADNSPTPAELLAQGPRLCPLWMDHDPGIAGTMHFEVEPATGAATVTWQGVAHAGTPGTANTFQVALHPGGQIEYRYRAASNTALPALVGWSPGSGRRDPGNRDLTAVMPLFLEPDSVPLRLSGVGRPVIGGPNPFSLRASNVPASSLIGAMILSLTRHTPAIHLGNQGMPNCFQHVGLDVPLAFFPSGGSASYPLPVPGDPAFTGVLIQSQAAAFASGVNPLGVLTSNGLELRLDVQ